MTLLRTRILIPSVVVLSLGAFACGGSGEDDDDGDADALGSTCTPGSVAEVTSAGASPSCLAVARGAAVTFRNVGTSVLEIRSGPHPTHGSCPELDGTPPLPAGGEVTVTMTTEAACRYHDHLTNTGVALGTIRVGGATTGTPDGGGGY
jgi:hypothetical protein